MSETPKPENLIIIGSGIAGLTAAIYAARASLKPLVFEGHEPGGQLTLTTIVENYPGFPEGIDGTELVEKMKEQAERFGATFRLASVVDTDLSEPPFEVVVEDDESLSAHSIIVASGASARTLGLPQENELMGRGLSTCATCDGAFFVDGKVLVVGGGDSAMEESMFLTRFAKEVKVIHRRDKLRASQIMQDRAVANDKIAFLWNTEVVALLGSEDEGGLQGVRVIDNETGEERDLECDGLFYAIGHTPNTEMVKDYLELDELGYVIADGVFTGIEGVYAAGDVMDPRYRQAITAGGTGCMAALEAEEYLAEKGLA